MMGEAVTGITTMYTDIGMDTGDMLLKAETPIGETRDGGRTQRQAFRIGAELLIRSCANWSRELKRIPQNPAEATYEPKLDKETGRIDWSKTRARLTVWCAARRRGRARFTATAEARSRFSA